MYHKKVTCINYNKKVACINYNKNKLYVVDKFAKQERPQNSGPQENAMISKEHNVNSINKFMTVVNLKGTNW